MKLATNFLDFFYPQRCIFCGSRQEGSCTLCAGCAGELPRVVVPFCKLCGEVFHGQIDGAFDCPNCTSISFHFEFARAAMDRSEKALELIHRLKYEKRLDLAREIASLACDAFSDKRLALAAEAKWPLMPVPLHWARKRERGFNQAEEIAKEIAREMDLPMMHDLKRVRRTKTQTRLSRKQRMENLKGAFALRKSWFMRKNGQAHLVGLPGIILVDDVFTTGSTVDACAKVLRKAGVKRVIVLTVMRG